MRAGTTFTFDEVGVSGFGFSFLAAAPIVNMRVFISAILTSISSLRLRINPLFLPSDNPWCPLWLTAQFVVGC